MDSALILFGRLHPLILHFPIALIVLAATVETVRLKREFPCSGSLVAFFSIAGALGAAAAAATGWVFAGESTPRPSMVWALQWHRWLGVATAVIAGAAARAAWRVSDSTSARGRWLRRGMVWLAALVLIGASHLGALLVWGGDFFHIEN